MSPSKLCLLVVGCWLLRAQAGIDYFLPPVPEFDAEDERSLIEAIRVDEQDAGKETVFAANLKKALKLIRQSNSKNTAPVARSLGRPSVWAVGDDRDFEGEHRDRDVAHTHSGFDNTKDWWSDQGWVARYCRVSPSTMIKQLKEAPCGWFDHWESLSEAERRQITKLSAIEVTHSVSKLVEPWSRVHWWRPVLL
jgi:hypothetical protein